MDVDAGAMKILLVICDGMGDRPVEQLKGMTPLEAADIPNMDRLAKEGQTGLMDVIAPGIAPGSDTAHLALLGYDPLEVYTGRGPFEAAGNGMELRKGDVAFRCNFATVDDGLVVTDRRAGRISAGTDELANSLNGMTIDGAEIIFKEAIDHRAVLILRGQGLSPEVGDIDPHDAGVRILEAKPLSPEAEKTARVLNEFTRRSHEILDAHPVNAARRERGEPPANIVLPRGAGTPPDVPSFSEMHNGIEGAAVVGISLVKGLCGLAGLKVITPTGATGSSDTDLDAKVDATVAALKTHDFLLLHFKAPDVYGHDNDPVGKMRFIEKIDMALGRLLGSLGNLNVVICVTADHSTPCSVMNHSSDPVPVLIRGRGLRVDDVTLFSESEVSKGGLGHVRGCELMNILTGLAGKSEKFGA